MTAPAPITVLPPTIVTCPTCGMEFNMLTLPFAGDCESVPCPVLENPE